MKTASLFTTLLLASLAPLGAAVLPYSNDFSGTGSNTALTESTDAHWALNNGAYRFNFTSTSVAASSASVPITGVAGAAFEVETQFTVVSAGTVNANGETLGFGLFGADAGFGGATGTPYYLADFQYANSTTGTGRLRIISLPNDPSMTSAQGLADDNAGSSALALVLGTTYTLRLEGSYSGSTLNMTLGLFKADGTTQIGTSATASDPSALTGTHFGFRNRIGISGGAATIDFDNYSVAAIPEPSSALPVGCLALFGALGMKRKLRRQA